MNMQPLISVIICTHNPRRDYLMRVLQALKSQTLSTELWELLLIDNASEQLLSSEIDLSWHPQPRHIREEKLGLTPARLRGIKEAVAETLVFVDDDNVLDPDYLEVVVQIGKDFPMIGAWGGQIRPGFEEQPPEWTKPYWWMLALREFDRDKWSNLLYCYETGPCGAGLCVRKTVAEKYFDLLQNDPKRSALDRKGKQLISCGDIDLAFTSCDLGLGTGQFVALNLTHLMPSSRFKEEYLLRLAEANGYSSPIMESFRGKVPNLPKTSWMRKLLNHYKLRRMNSRERRFHEAFARGQALAIQELFNT
jgi:glycosyltransferase involved in cell wall biosynthesis